MTSFTIMHNATISLCRVQPSKPVHEFVMMEGAAPRPERAAGSAAGADTSEEAVPNAALEPQPQPFQRLMKELSEVDAGSAAPESTNAASSAAPGCANASSVAGGKNASSTAAAGASTTLGPRCRCGSYTHMRVSHVDCPLNKRRQEMPEDQQEGVGQQGKSEGQARDARERDGGDGAGAGEVAIEQCALSAEAWYNLLLEWGEDPVGGAGSYDSPCPSFFLHSPMSPSS